MAGSYQKHKSLCSFLRIRYFHDLQMDTELENFESEITNNRRHLYHQLNAFGINKNLFKQHPKSSGFYVTSEAAILFTSLLDIAAEGKYGKLSNPKMLSSNSVLLLRKQLLDALLSCRMASCWGSRPTGPCGTRQGSPMTFCVGRSSCAGPRRAATTLHP